MVDTTTINLSDFFVGQDYNRTFQLKDGTTPKDITSYTWNFIIRSPGASVNTVEKTMSIATAASGLFNVALDTSDTDDLNANRVYNYQIQGTTDAGERHVYVEGEFEAKTTF